MNGHNPENNVVQNRFGFQNMKIRPPKYSGKNGSESIKQFCSRFERYTNHQRVDDNDLVACLGITLESEALEIFDSLLRNHENISYENIKEAFILRYDQDGVR